MERLEWEKEVIQQMIYIFCARHHEHSKDKLCGDCEKLLAYAFRRLDTCPKGNTKSSCRKCKIHCYVPIYRSQIREIMKYVGPRMIFIHPVNALRNILAELK